MTIYSQLYRSNSKINSLIKIPSTKLSKLSPRNHEGLINQNNYPTPFTYSPNYNGIIAKVKNCNSFFENLFILACLYNTKTKENIKKSIIRKVCFSYDQGMDIKVAKLENLIEL